jgi:hypothetical protein
MMVLGKSHGLRAVKVMFLHHGLRLNQEPRAKDQLMMVPERSHGLRAVRTENH